MAQSPEEYVSPIDQQAGELRAKLLVAAIVSVCVFGLGTFGYFALGAGRWTLADCAYMTVISITTVGYGEILDGLDQVPGARLFTAALLLFGVGTALYAVSVMTTFFVEGEFFDLRRRRKMMQRIAAMDQHIVVCGAGRTGRHIAAELAATDWKFVIIDHSQDAIDALRRLVGHEIDYVLGDATDDAVLIDAGVKRAQGVLTALSNDRDNLFVVVSARGINPSLRVVSKAVDPRAVNKLKSAGASRVVSVNQIGGQRLASEMIRPSVVTFLDTMMRDRDQNLRFEEVTIPKGSPLCGKVLSESDIRRERKLLVVAAKPPETARYTYSPGPDFPLEEDMTLIIIGETESVERLRQSGLFLGPT